MSLPTLLIACALAAAAAWAGTGLFLKVLVRFEVYDDPCARSSHHRRKPTGGGFAVVAVVIAAWLGYSLWIGAWPQGFWAVLLGTALLVVISGIDDVRDLPVAPRFLVQVVAVALGLLGLGETGLVFQGLLPPLLDRLATAFLWLWFVNLFNFMDGIDGIGGVEAASIGLGLGLVAWLTGLTGALTVLPPLLAAAALGFLLWNWAPSKVFLGDVGSVPLGYLLGWLLLVAASQGQWAPALILPLYYLCDATLTLGRRALRGETVWHVHREHLYQRIVQAGYGHAQVALMVLGCNSVLIALALLASTGRSWPALLGAAVFMAVGFLVLERRLNTKSR